MEINDSSASEAAPGNPIRIMIVDDYYVVRRGLRMILAKFDSIEVVAEASDGDYAVSLCRETRPDVVLMDIRMPRKDGVEATRQIIAERPQTRILALTAFSEEADIQGILQAGAIGFLMKNVSGDELTRAIFRAYEGQSTVAPEAAQFLIHMSNSVGAPPRDYRLTDRETEVLGAMARGMSNREIAIFLQISYSTVKNHVSNILNKLGTTSRIQAVVQAIEYKLV